MTNEMKELADRIERQDLEFKSEGGYLSDDDSAMIAAALRSTAAQADVRAKTIEECALRADNQARIPGNTPERRAHIYCAEIIAKAIRALKVTP